MLTACPPASRDQKIEGKNKKQCGPFFDPRGEDKKEKQTKPPMNVRNVYILV